MHGVQQAVKRLEKQLGRIQVLQFVLLAIVFLLIAVIIVYLPLGSDSLLEVCAKFEGKSSQDHD